MDHTQAAESHLVEQYLLEELSPELRDEFEEHFFDCIECAAELRMTGAFLDAARGELQQSELALQPVNQAANQTPIELEKPRAKLIPWPTAFALASIAACLLVAVLLYQSFVTLPRLRRELASLDTPEVLPTLSLAAGVSRGGVPPSITRNGAEAVLLQFDIPTPQPDSSQDRPSSEPITQTPTQPAGEPSSQAPFLSYTCTFYSPTLEPLWTIQLPAQAAHDTVNLRVPLKSKVGGTYILEVKGHQNSSPGDTGVTVANYRFSLNAGSNGAGH